MALPNTYYRLDYIQSSGSQYIDTDLAPSYNLKALVKGRFTNNTGSQYAIGCYQATNINRFDVGLYNGSLQLNIGSYKDISDVDVLQTHTYILDAPNNCTYIDDTQYTGYTTQTGSNARNVLLFARWQSSITYYANFQAEAYQFWQNGVLVRDFIPAMRKSDNVVGLYDDVNDVFYTNAGSGTFTYGSIIYEVSVDINPLNSGSVLGVGTYTSGTQANLIANANGGYAFDYWELDDYVKLDYIESTGTQYIDTGIIYTNDLIEIEVGLSSTDVPSGTYKTLLGMYTASANGSPFSIWTYSDFGQNFKDDVSGANYPYTFDGTSQTFTFTNNRRTGTAYNIFLFKANAKGGATYYGLSELKIEYTKIKVNNTLSRNYIPVKRISTNEIGLLDLIDLKFYGNSGTGTFNYGQELGTITFNDNPLSFIVNDDVSFIANFKRTANCRFKVNGEWKMAMMYKKINGEWVTGPTRVKVNGTWKDGS